MHRKSYIILGVLLGLFGFGIIINPSVYHSAFRYQFDFTEVKWPLGGVLIILGCFFIWSSFRKKTIEANRKDRDGTMVLMCPKCIKPFYKKDAPTLKCPDCENTLENLSGFYERHPDLRK